ncbi:hypothetical protein RAK27_05180 [Carnobacterium maltaromaticum]|uniref:DUF2634 domain-containing protein n=1 Tax=Carnobacterium maltaromaticum TaxID=2751 RepID=A0AAW9JN57_CARML|nr:hypothetical protein [Carnobacterium maltaromaticum]MDZ5758045.1 hypothetical protein [Carnobacterium maltaromaticum]
MKSISLSKDDDINLINGSFFLVESEDEVLQSITSLLRIRLGEFDLDEYIGLDRNNLLGKKFSANGARDDLIECMSQDNRIEMVNELSIVASGRTISIKFEAKLISTEYETDSTIKGEVQLNV